MVNIQNLDELIQYYEDGNQIKYIFFWSHKENSRSITKACLSQWYYSPFINEGVTYKTSEHFMMAQKAKLFGDYEKLKEIIAAKEAGYAKHLGREVANFNEEIWQKYRFDIVTHANYLKFSQQPQLKEFLLNSGNRVLVEASPVDRVRGIGLSATSNDNMNPTKWRGLNLLGFALMRVRKILRENKIYNLNLSFKNYFFLLS